MFNLHRAGGIAAWVDGLAYVVGFVFMATVLNPGDTGSWDLARKLAFVLQNKGLFQACSLIIYLLFGVALVVLVVALHERLNAAAAKLMGVASAFGLIWAGLVLASGMIEIVGLNAIARLHAVDAVQAQSAWVAVTAVQNGLGGGIELVGGIWVILISLAARQARALPHWLINLGYVVGLAGVATLLPALNEVAMMLFGLSQIPWFFWVGSVLWRGSAEAACPNMQANAG